MANARTEVDKLHLGCDRRDEVDHLTHEVKTGFSVNLGGEGNILVQIVGISDGSVVNLLEDVFEQFSIWPLVQPGPGEVSSLRVIQQLPDGLIEGGSEPVHGVPTCFIVGM